MVDYIIKNNITSIYLCGVDIDCCVLKTAFDFF
ncbi:MAG: isochorismatase family protein [Bacilli bacterium]|nr:isochorismatase family protein [Bacilli bacterium]